MKRPQRKFLHLVVGAAVLAILSSSMFCQGAWSQTTRTIKIVVPFPPGGGIDVLARVIAEQVGRAQGVTVVVENRPGAATVIATEAVSRAEPDGNTILMANNTFVVAPHTHKVSYDPFSGFEPICRVGSTPTIIAVNSASPYHTLEDLLNAARTKPGEITYGTSPGSAMNVAFERLGRMANLRMTFVPFGGTPPVISAVLGGHIDVAIADYPVAAGQIQAGTLRALATGSRRRLEELPDVPTVAESGYKDYALEIWYGLVAPAKTPKEVVSQLADWFTSSVQVPEIRSKLAAQGISAKAVCGAQFSDDLHQEYDTYGRAIREGNIKAE